MRERTQGSRLFLVGDDWQSIYRFAGSDLDLFVSAPDRLGPTIRTDLDQTFRLESDVLSVSSRFVMRNPGQLRKELRARAASGSLAGVSIRFYDPDELLQCFASALEDIAFRTEGAVSVLVLARYLHVFKDLDLKDPSLTHSGRIELLPSTVHRAKGLEADHVVVLDLRAGTHGFPSEIADDRVLRIVTHGEDDFRNAEERRLFYVALTRTRGRVYLLAGSDRPSGFVQELLADEYSDAIEVFGAKSERHRCPLCQGMTIRQKAGREGTFWACLHYPRCEGNLTICDACGEGAIEPEVTENRVVRFRCSRCPATAEVCPACGTGALLARRGPFGSFWGCSNWRRDESGCVFTKKANIAGQSS
jgi:DNA helicase-4